MTLNQNLQFIDEVQKDFLEEATFLLDQCEESYLRLEKAENRKEELDKIFRLAHSLKGAGAAVGFTDLSEFAHVVEDCLSVLRVKTESVTLEVVSLLLKAGDAFKVRVKMLKEKSGEPWEIIPLQEEVKKMTQVLEKNKNEQKKMIATENKNFELHNKTQAASVKIDTNRIDAVLDIVGELVVLKSQLVTETVQYQSNIKLNGLISLFEKSIRELQDKALGMRMTPLKSLFLKTQRIVRDLSVRLNKPVLFEMFGEDTEIDRTMVESLGDPIMHIVRNAIDHGIENIALRKERGKSPEGKIRLVAQQVGGRVVISISDDGGGINPQKIIKKALEKGLIQDDVVLNSVNHQKIYQLIFAPGFSTAEAVTDVSGRGVGLDVVKTNIEKLNGAVQVSSHLNQGSTFTISIPLTTSITDGMQVKIYNQPYILPLKSIRELVSFESGDTTKMQSGQEMLNVRGIFLPIVDLENVFFSKKRSENADNSFVSKTAIVVEGVDGFLALKVHEVLGQVQVVLKPFGEYLTHLKGIAGAAILGDGKVALVLDVNDLDAKTGYI